MTLPGQAAQNGSARAWADFADSAAPMLAAFERSLEQPAVAQRSVLEEIIRYGSGTAYGRAHGFADITSIEQFRERVPVTGWREHAPWIERAKSEPDPVLTADTPVHFERTSGSTAIAKDIPYTPRLLAQLQRALTVWLAKLYDDCPRVAGPAWWSLSPIRSRSSVTASGIPIGSAGDEIYLEGSIAQRLFETVIDMRPALDADDWKTHSLALAIECEHLALISVWSPTYLSAMLEPVVNAQCRLEGLRKLKPLLPKHRYHMLVDSLEAGDLSLLWPDLEIISAWSDGPSRVYAGRIAAQFSQASVVPKGLFATEGVVSIPWGMSHNCVLAIESHFLEFIGDDGAEYLVEDLEPGRVYEPVLTTAGGLYRYALGDLIEVTGIVGATAAIRYVGRADLRCDLVGEKLDAAIVTAAFRATGVSAPSMLIPAIAAPHPHYVLVTEAVGEAATLAATVDAALEACHHYGIARDNGQLGPLECRRCDNLSALLHEGWEALQKRSGDVKPVSLVVSPELALELLELTSAGARPG